MTASSTDRITKEVTLRAPLARVWKAITDSQQFGEWFGVMLDGPFRAGESIKGRITHPGCEHMTFEATVETMSPQTAFAFRWNPTGDSAAAGDPSTLVEFRLEEVKDGTKLTVIESGFDSLPPEGREEYLRRNEAGWVEQMQNVKNYVDG